MYTLILGFLKKKVFTEAGAVLIPLLSFIALILFCNADLILSKMGFETRANLSKQVAVLEQQLEELERRNATLTKELGLALEADTKNQDALNRLCQEKEVTDDAVEELINKRDRQLAEPKTPTVEKQPQQPDKPSIAAKRAPPIAQANIDMIHEAYASFFPES